MCLLKITKVHEVPLPEERLAWKILATSCSEWQFPYRGEHPAMVGVWMKANPVVIHTDQTVVEYVSGFHVYPTRKEAEKAHQEGSFPFDDKHVVAVRVRGIRTEGIDGSFGLDIGVDLNLTNWVADEMFIPITPEQLFDGAQAKLEEE